jgi:hypothetical protein
MTDRKLALINGIKFEDKINIPLLEQLECISNPFNDNFQNIISKYNNIQAQDILQSLRDAYLIPTDTLKESYVLK